MDARQPLSLPQHRDPDPNRTASAPYNFVPLPEMVVPAVPTANDLPDHDRYCLDRHSGYFEVTLTTLAPLYIRCPLPLADFLRQDRTPDAKLPSGELIKNTPHFFYTQDPATPIIPGSSLRGMLRALLEIVSYGKMQGVTTENLVYRAVGDPSVLGDYYREQILGVNKTRLPNVRLDYPSLQVRGGYLRQNGNEWAIQPAQKISGETFVHVSYADATPLIGGVGRQRVHEVFVQPISRVASNRGQRGPGMLTLDLAVTPTVAIRTPVTPAPVGLVPAVLVESGHMGGGHAKHWHCAIYDPDNLAPPLRISHEMWELYREDRDQPHGIPPRRLAHDGDPLFYLLDAGGNLVFFGPTMMFRLPYKQTPYDLVPDDLHRPEDLDYAEALFGFVRSRRELDDLKKRNKQVPKQGEKAFAYASRVSVTDAQLLAPPSNIWLSEVEANQIIRPHILATPKPTAFQHYLTQQNPNNKKQLDHYDSPPPHQTVIRGHKRYWHQGLGTDQGLTLNTIRSQIQDSTPAPNQPDTQHTRFKPVRPNVRFGFRVYFENLLDGELGALCWTLCPLGAESTRYAHHLGMGKPLGMGAVDLAATLHLTARSNRYSALFIANGWQTGTAGPGEDLTDRATLEARVKPFEDHVLQMLNPDPPCTHLSGMKRIAMLLKMLEWPGFPSKPDGPCSLPPPDNRPNTRYMTIQGQEYKLRPVLPSPEKFGRLTGEAVPRGHEPPEELPIDGDWLPLVDPPTPLPPPVPAMTDYAVGATLIATVEEVEQDGDVILIIPGLPRMQGCGIIPQAEVGNRQYQAGQRIRIEVVEIQREPNGNTFYWLRPGHQRPH